MSIPTPRQRCESDGCKKQATTAIAYKTLFGHQVTGQGMVPQYMNRVTFRCPEHEDVRDAWGKREIKAYREAALAKSSAPA